MNGMAMAIEIVVQAGAEQGGDGQRQHQGREGEQGVHDPHEDAVAPAAEVARR